mmetsp:Transcript_53525/g.150805  ORF Transcript_53525/g.150805 Transcript_53525/m.150805 type:complete len:224 (-) Transcript_53525:403-1074(-)
MRGDGPPPLPRLEGGIGSHLHCAQLPEAHIQRESQREVLQQGMQRQADLHEATLREANVQLPAEQLLQHGLPEGGHHGGHPRPPFHAPQLQECGPQRDQPEDRREGGAAPRRNVDEKEHAHVGKGAGGPAAQAGQGQGGAPRQQLQLGAAPESRSVHRGGVAHGEDIGGAGEHLPHRGLRPPRDGRPCLVLGELLGVSVGHGHAPGALLRLGIHLVSTDDRTP